MRTRTIKEMLNLLDSAVSRKDKARAEVERLERLIVSSPAFNVRPFDPAHAMLCRLNICRIGAATVRGRRNQKYKGPHLVVLLQYASNESPCIQRQVYGGPHSFQVLNLYCSRSDGRTFSDQVQLTDPIAEMVQKGEAAIARRDWENEWRAVLNHNEVTSPLVDAYDKASLFYNCALEALAVLLSFNAAVLESISFPPRNSEAEIKAPSELSCRKIRAAHLADTAVSTHPFWEE